MPINQQRLRVPQRVPAPHPAHSAFPIDRCRRRPLPDEQRPPFQSDPRARLIMRRGLQSLMVPDAGPRTKIAKAWRPASGSLRRKNPRDMNRSGAAGTYGDCGSALAVVLSFIETASRSQDNRKPLEAVFEHDDRGRDAVEELRRWSTGNKHPTPAADRRFAESRRQGLSMTIMRCLT